MNIKIRFKGTHLGFVWAALEPTLIFLLLYVVFTSIRISNREDFPIYLLTGIFFYHIFTRGTMGGLSSLIINKGILRSINFNKEFFAVVTTVAIGLLALVELSVLFGLMPFFNYIPPWTVVFLPIVIILLFILILGLSYLLSILNIFVRDTQLIWAILVQALFFISPIFWYKSDAEGILLEIHKINPLGQLIEIAHNLIIFGTIPNISEWLYTAILSVSILLIGYSVFRKYQSRIIEEV